MLITGNDDSSITGSSRDNISYDSNYIIPNTINERMQDNTVRVDSANNPCPDDYENVIGYNRVTMDDSNPHNILKCLRSNNIDKIIISHLNINSVRNKFDHLVDLIMGNIDILLISETKIDDSFPTNQFQIKSFSLPYRLDRDCNGGGLLLYIRDDIPSRILNNFPVPNAVECFFVEINFYKIKWLICVNYNPNKSNISRHLETIGKGLDLYLPNYDNVLLFGDFNSEPSENDLLHFCELYNLKNIVKEPTCFKNYDNPSCIDLILTNKQKSFQNTTILETGLSDFHKMTCTVLKLHFKHAAPKIINYRSYKNYNAQSFNAELEFVLQENNFIDMSNDEFTKLVLETLEKHAPMKTKYIRANQSPFITKEIRKSIMKRTQLKNKYMKRKTFSNKAAYNRQRNICGYLIKKTKKQFYSNLNPAHICDNKTFWGIVKPFFTDKKCSSENIRLMENNEITKDDLNTADIFNEFFSNAVTNLNIEPIPTTILDEVEKDPILNAIKIHENHPSIIKIKEKIEIKECFSMKEVVSKDIKQHIISLRNRVANPKDAIPPKIIKENCEIFTLKLKADFNNMIANSTFPFNLKNADVTPVLKKGNKFEKINYRPVSILPAISKIFERLLFCQINDFMDSKISKYQCGFRNFFSAQHCLILMLEKWRTSVDNKGCAGSLLTDLSKAFDCLNHDLLIAKLEAYGFDYLSLNLISSYLSNRYQRVRINSSYSLWSEIITGVPQGSILGPLIFNIYLSDLFLFEMNSVIINYADDNTPLTCDKDMNSVISKLENDSKILLNWVKNNGLKANPDKFHLLTSATENSQSIRVENYDISNSKSEKLLGVIIDNKLDFTEHVSKICKTASKKLHALSRIAHYMDINQKRTIMHAFVKSQFGYCPLVWMFHNRTLNNRINKIHERALRIAYNDHDSSFDKLLEKDNSVTIHHRNIQALAIEIFKIIKGISPKFMNEIFGLKEEIKYCSRFSFKSRNIKTTKYGSETLSFLGPKIWFMLPNDIKDSVSLVDFKKKIKMWKPLDCPCRICKVYVAGVGFVS